MNLFRVSAIVAAVALIAGPASAQAWNDGGYGPGWREGYAPAYNYGPYGPYGYGGYGSGETDIAICPPRYHLGRSGRLCWPD